MTRWYVFGLSIFVSISLLIIFYFFLSIASTSTCNDGTFYNECSDVNPYFCSNGILIEKASACGCSNLSKINGDRCISFYQSQNESKNISLQYTLRGENGQMNFTVYKKLNDYLSSLPRNIDSEENPTFFDFKVKSLDEKNQRELLLPLVVAIENLTSNKEDQARIAISLIQNIPFGNSTKTLKFGNLILEYKRYPYEVLYDNQGVCSEKSELLVFILRELGYETSFLYYGIENHEAVGIKCPIENSLDESGYCFIETTGPSIISDYKTEYIVFGQLISSPEIISFEGELTFGENFYEFEDAQKLEKIRERARNYGTINFIQHLQFNNLKKKYGLESF